MKKLSSQSITNEDNSSSNYFGILLILLAYLTIDFFPKTTLDVAGIQWIAITVINSFVAVYLFYNNKNNEEKYFLNFNKTTILYSIFIFLSGVSILFATNKVEGIATFVKLLLVFITFILLNILSKEYKKLLLNFSIIVSIILFFQCFLVISNYYGNINKVSYDKISQILAANTGNVNIFASAILLKIPFVIFCLFHFTSAKKYFFLVTIFLASIVLFLTSSRTNILSLSIYIALLAGFLYKINSLKSNIKTIVALVITILFGYTISNYKSQKSSSNIIENNVAVEKKNNGDATSANAFSGNRFTLWNNTFELIKQNPLTGFGLGSYKIEVIPFESKQRDYYAISGHAHNDFLQIASESGILTAILYLSIFILCFITAIKHVFNNNNDEEKKWIAFIVLLSIIAFGVDSLLNFPIDRPITQIHFVILFFWLFSISKSNENSKVIKSKLVLISLFVLSCILLIPTVLNYKSLKGQNSVFADENEQKLTYAQVDAILPNYPNITAYGSPVKAVKASYLIKEENFNDAQKLLNESLFDNKYLKYNENLKANIFSKQKQYDSLVKYRKECYEMFPLLKSFYTNYMVALRNKKDTLGIKNAVNYAKNYNAPKNFETIGIDLINVINGKAVYKNETKNTTNNAVATQKPVNQEKINTTEIPSLKNNQLKNGKEIIELTAKINQLQPEDWTNRLAISQRLNQLVPNNPIHHMNIGMSYFKLNKLDSGIPYLEKAMQSNYFKNGLPEFVLGTTYIIKNQKDKACPFIKIAKDKGYVIPSNIQNNCN